MMEITRFKREHMAHLFERGVSPEMRPMMTAPRLDHLENTAFTVQMDGVPVACGGVAEYWPGRGEAWAIVDGPVCKANFVAFHRTIKRFIESNPTTRIEASVASDFSTGRRWVELLGFKLEADRLQSYLPNGKDGALYSRVRQVE